MQYLQSVLAIGQRQSLEAVNENFLASAYGRKFLV